MTNNESIAELVEIYLSISSTRSEEHDYLAKSAFTTMQKVFKQMVANSNEPIVLPYKDISDTIFQSSHHVKSNSLESFQDKVGLLIDEFQAKSRYKTKGQRLKACHRKLVGHIMLAYAQKEFIQDSVRQAQETAKKAEVAAESAEEIAKIAKNNADKAEKTYNTMFANYVTILGIFTAIIVTIFGGLNVVDTVISYGNTHFSTIIFLAALVLICVVCLLYFLAKIILKLNGKDDDNQRFTLECLFGAIFITCIGLIVFAWCVSPTKTTPKIDKTTDKIEQKAN
ncbi:hypothetical protein CPI40_05530 [Moraxella catarrhalis]|uniref:hypothetical protein n=1 Tax=Moraxella catarrhalis TaxID=480 RepID=UPI00128D91FD|nr:hypothetical protein [Moraxella catarrhalis]MPW74594.1 hypothetical protein [Moraxella catarrhalis]